MSGLPIANPMPAGNTTEASIATSGQAIPFPKSGSAEAIAQAAHQPDAHQSNEATSMNRDADNSAAAPESELLNRVVQGAHDAIDKLAGHAAPHVQRLQDSVAETGEKLQAQAEQVRQTGDEWTDSLRKTVRENPLASVAAALALGMIVARLTS